MLTIRVLALACASFPLVSATPDTSVIVNPELAVVKIDCGRWMGSGFRIDDHTIVSVNHVVKSGKCSIDGTPIRILYSAKKQDFATLQGNEGPSLPVDCGGFVKGRKYIAIGYARDADTQTETELVAAGTTGTDGQARLDGMYTVIPGQSGGPVVDALTHRPVGTVNAYNYEAGASWSVALKDTPICGGRVV